MAWHKVTRLFLHKVAKRYDRTIESLRKET